MSCNFCGAELPPTALFCGECGRSLGLGSRPIPTIVERTIELRVDPTAEIAPEPEPVLEPEPVPEPEPEPTPEPEPEPAPEPGPAPEPAPEPEPEAAPELEPELPLAPTSLPATDPWLPRSRLLPPAAHAASADPTEHDVEATRIVPSTLTGQRFVLQFSTGESVTIFGNGLVGRNPVAEPSEYFDHLITIVDPGKSVSKTHLEFGQVAGAFWVSDRYSGNGTVVREPDGVPLRCESGKRYRIVRGTRVIMGDQFFVVS